MNFTPLENAVESLTRSAQRFSKQIAKLQFDGMLADDATITKIDKLLMESSPELTDPGGLPGRPWFENQIPRAARQRETKLIEAASAVLEDTGKK